MPLNKTRHLVALTVLVLLCGRAHGQTDPVAQADAFLRGNGLSHAARHLRQDEKAALGRALVTPKRQLSNGNIVKLLKNPTAWTNNGSEGRGLLRTIVKSLPEVAALPNVDNTAKLASNRNPANYRGYGVEIIASAALNRYRTEEGQRAHMTRMGGDIRGLDGRLRESDGSVMLGADGLERLVTVKSLSSLKSMKSTLKKAADQLALRNLQRDGSRQPGVMVVGYDNPAIYAKLKTKNWQASTDRSGAKLLVLAVNQLTGKAEKLASFEPDPKSTIKPKSVKPRQRWVKLARRTALKHIGRRSPGTARRLGKVLDRLQGKRR